MAQSRGRPLSHREIAKRSGLSPTKVQRIAKLKSWGNITLHDAEAFAYGCGFVLGQHHRILRLLSVALNDGGLMKLRHLTPSGKFYERGGKANLVKFIVCSLES